MKNSSQKKTERLAELLDKHRGEIEDGSLVVYIIDECHLNWNDICGYFWNLIKSPFKIPLLNPKERQTYYGALNLLTQEFVLVPSKTANGELTVEFVKTLQAKDPDARILLIWDGASYHRGEEMKTFLTQENQGVLQRNGKLLVADLLLTLLKKILLRRFGYN